MQENSSIWNGSAALQARCLHLFERTYELQAHLRADGRKVFLGDRHRKHCRFCDGKPPAVSFKSKAHVIPRQLGGKGCYNYFECDNCNQLFSKYESSLAAYLSPLRSLWQLSGYDGVPVYKNHHTGIRIEAKHGKVNITSTKEGDPGFKIDPESNSATICVGRDAYIPLHVYKALLRIAMCLLPDEEVPNFWRAYRWLQLPSLHHPGRTYQLCGWFFDSPKVQTEVMLFRRKIIDLDSKAPEKVFVIRFGHLQYQMPIVLSDQDAALELSCGLSWTSPVFPVFLPTGGREPEILQLEPVELNSIEKRTNDRLELEITSDEPMLRQQQRI